MAINARKSLLTFISFSRNSAINQEERERREEKRGRESENTKRKREGEKESESERREWVHFIDRPPDYSSLTSQSLELS